MTGHRKQQQQPRILRYRSDIGEYISDRSFQNVSTFTISRARPSTTIDPGRTSRMHACYPTTHTTRIGTWTHPFPSPWTTFDHLECMSIYYWYFSSVMLSIVTASSRAPPHHLTGSRSQPWSIQPYSPTIHTFYRTSHEVQVTRPIPNHTMKKKKKPFKGADDRSVLATSHKSSSIHTSSSNHMPAYKFRCNPIQPRIITNLAGHKHPLNRALKLQSEK